MPLQWNQILHLLSRTSQAGCCGCISYKCPRGSVRCQLPLVHRPSARFQAMVAGSSREHTQKGSAKGLFNDHELHDLGSSHGALEDQKFDIEGPQRRVTPLPKAQLVTLCSVRLIDPIAFTQIFPYVNEMMDRLHLTNDPSKIGFYSGLVVSVALLIPPN